MLVSAVGGGLMIFGTLLAAPDILAPELSTVGIAYVLTAVAGPFWGPVVLAIVAVSIFSAALAISASATRVMFSMARDGQLPFAKALAKVSPRTHTPILPGIVVGVLSIAVLLINLGQTSVFATVTAISVVVVYLAYLFVTVPLLVQRLRRNPAHTQDPAYFSLGRWGLPVNAVAVLFGVFMLVNIGWPRAEIYDLDGRGWYFQWSAPLAILVIVVAGLVAYRFLPRDRSTAGRAGSLRSGPRPTV